MMKLLIYNIAYGTGSPGQGYKRLFTSHRYLRTHCGHFEKIITFISEQKPDVIGLVEADSGSFRTGKVDQVKKLAASLEHYHVCETKYGQGSPARQMPILRNHVNAVLSRKKETASKFHFFPNGVKKLIIEAEIGGVIFFLLHLSLRKNTRVKQLDYLSNLIPADKPVIIAGDLNTRDGEKELNRFKKRHNLHNPNKANNPTYPSWNPKRQLDYILCSESLEVCDFSIPDIQLSDHLPLIIEFSKNRVN